MEHEIDSVNYNDFQLKGETSSQLLIFIKGNNDLNKVIPDEITESEGNFQSMPANTYNNYPARDNNFHYHDKDLVTPETTDRFSMKRFIRSSANGFDDIYMPQTNHNLPNNSKTPVLTSTSDIRKLGEKGKDNNKLFKSASESYISEEVTDLKGILVNPGEQRFLKKTGSKGAIRWRDSVKESLNKEKTNSISTAQLLMTHGSQIKYIHTIVDALRLNEEAEFVKKPPPKELLRHDRVSSLTQDLGSEIFKKRQYVELTSEQEDKLKQLKQNIKMKNDEYVRNHPELGVLLSLVYKQLFKYLPDNPVHFVADYIHHLNTHREEMILEPDIDVPFDNIQQLEMSPSQDREQVTQFARKLVERCVKIASKRISFANVMSVIESLLATVCPTENDIQSTVSSIRSTTNVVSGILMTLITSVAEMRTRDTELFTAEILEAILENVCPSAKTDSEIYLKILESVQELVKSLVDKATREIEQRKSDVKSQIESVDLNLYEDN